VEGNQPFGPLDALIEQYTTQGFFGVQTASEEGQVVPAGQRFSSRLEVAPVVGLIPKVLLLTGLNEARKHSCRGTRGRNEALDATSTSGHAPSVCAFFRKPCIQDGDSVLGGTRALDRDPW
jgi:hypothetical protein